MKAAKAADQLFDLLPPLDVGDPQAFIAGTAAILAKYPDVVIDAAVDPVRGIPSRTDRPTLKLIKAVCEEIYAPILRRMEREEVARKSFRALPRPPRTPEEQARIDKQVAEAREKLGIQPGAGRRKVILPPSADAPFHSGLPGSLDGDGKHALRVEAALAKRRAHSEALAETSKNTENEADTPSP